MKTEYSLQRNEVVPSGGENDSLDDEAVLVDSLQHGETERCRLSSARLRLSDKILRARMTMLIDREMTSMSRLKFQRTSESIKSEG